ncbi:MAG: putative heat shock protein DnaJ, N-terminal [Myxococcales bacterium]|nr:putative heat shock protein DnaJ, N-terminal [Myxococcales bacterium]
MLEDNPFFVLGLPADTSRIEIEREAQKLLGMLELGFADTKTYQTPLGARPRTPELVRAAVAALRDPYRRLIAELWARHAPAPTTAERATDPAEPSHPGLRRSLGWGP